MIGKWRTQLRFKVASGSTSVATITRVLRHFRASYGLATMTQLLLSAAVALIDAIIMFGLTMVAMP